MMKRFIKLLAVWMALCMLFPTLPVLTTAEQSGIAGKKGIDYSSNSYLSGKIQQIFDLLVYSGYPYFTVDGAESCGNTSCAECLLSAVCKNHPTVKDLNMSFTTVAYGSGAFARFAFALIFEKQLLSINIFGNVTATSGVQRVGRAAASSMAIQGEYDAMTADNLKAILQKGTPGDMILARSSSGSNHTMILLKADDTTVSVVHSLDYDVASSDLNKVVVSEMSYAEMISKWNQVISLLRAEQDVYEATMKKGTDLHLTHTYTDESGDICPGCGEKFVPVVSYESAGVYRAVKAATNYKGHYRSTGAGGRSFSENEYVEAMGSVVNSAGVRFYLLADGSYISSEDFVFDDYNTPSITSVQHPEGELRLGGSFDLRGTVYFAGGLRAMAGYLIRENGTIEQQKQINVSDSTVHIHDCDINSNLAFGKLPVGKYAYMLTVRAKNGRMSCVTSYFSVVRSTEKETPAAPSAPETESVGDTSVVLKTQSGCEYRVNDGAWQKSGKFTGLLPNTSYTFYARLAETQTANASAPSAGRTVRTDRSTPQAPSAPSALSVTSTSVTLSGDGTFEYKCLEKDNSWQSSATFTGLSPATSYTFYRRVAATANSYASQSSVPVTITTAKKSADAPDAPITAVVYSDSVELVPTEGYEYRIEGKTEWQRSPVFTGLSPATTYKFYQRRAATATTLASPESAPCSVTTAKRNASAPAAPTVISKTDVTVTLKAISGYEYRVDGGQWQTSNVFTGLKPASSHTFYQRIAETDSTAASAPSSGTTVVTLKADVPAPAAPTAESTTAYSVTLRRTDGCEYRLGNGAWRDDPIFDGLDPATAYTFYQRKKETDTTNASPASVSCTVTTKKRTVPAPAAPTAGKTSDVSVTLTAISGYEYRIEGGQWQTSPIFMGLSPATAYTFYQRVAETATDLVSPSSAGAQIRTAKSDVKAPAAPKMKSKTAYSVTLNAVEGCEYRVGNGAWQTGVTFEGLSPATDYVFYQRLKETATTNASPASPGLTVRTAKGPGKTASAPTAYTVTDSSVTLNSVSGCEYRIEGGTWQRSSSFGGLEAAKTYKFYQRYYENDVALAGAESKPLEVTTKKHSAAAPGVPGTESVGDTTVVLKKNDKYEYSCGGSVWQDSATFTGLVSNTEYTFYARTKETATSYASPASIGLRVRTDYSQAPKPSAPRLVSVRDKTVVLAEGEGLEYSVDSGKTWQSSPIFELVTYGEKHFICRTAATERCYPSPASDILAVTVNPGYLTSGKLTVNSGNNTVSGVSAKLTCAQMCAMLNEGDFVTVFSADGVKMNAGDTVRTGMILRLPEGREYRLSVKGDANGDGSVDIFDMGCIADQILNGDALTGVEFDAADVNGDAVVDIFDYVAVRDSILNGTVL